MIPTSIAQCSFFLVDQKEASDRQLLVSVCKSNSPGLEDGVHLI
jgi:hypothetical protein